MLTSCNRTHLLRRSIVAATLALCGAAPAALAQEYYERYDIALQSQVVDMGVQPMAYPLAFISATMQRDLLLREDLRKLGVELRVHPFRKGNDMVKLFGKSSWSGRFWGTCPP